MNKTGKILIVSGLVIAVGMVILAKQNKTPPENNHLIRETDSNKSVVPVPPDHAEKSTEGNITAQKLPRLVDLGAGRCVACKMMTPILEELKKDFVGRMQVEFIDVWENPDAGKDYGINIIPTQIFFDGAGRELFRHEGFMSKEDILAKWRQLGIKIN